MKIKELLKKCELYAKLASKKALDELYAQNASFDVETT